MVICKVSKFLVPPVNELKCVMNKRKDLKQQVPVFCNFVLIRSSCETGLLLLSASFESNKKLMGFKNEAHNCNLSLLL